MCPTEDWWIECRHEAWDVTPTAPRGVDRFADIAPSVRFETALANGIDVDGDAWATINAYANRTLVPDSEASRMSGAGAGMLDDD